MRREEASRSSLHVAPLSLSRSGPDGSDLASPSTRPYTTNSQMTPPVTPNGSQEDLNSMASHPTRVFSNHLRAYYPFHPNYALSDSAVTIPLNEGDVIMVHSIHTNGWADGTLMGSGARGWLPTNYCEPFEPEEMRNLLKAQLDFWDLLQSPAVDNSDFCGNQEFMKGLIAGVRTFLDRTNCLTRETPIMQRHEGLRRSRKSLLAELSGLVKSAKQLQEKLRAGQGQAASQVNIADEMILKAFRIIVKAVRFMDILEEDRMLQAPPMPTLEEEGTEPPTPPAEALIDTRGATAPAGFRTERQGGEAELGVAAHAAAASDRRLSPVANDRRTSKRPSTIAHRVSFAGLLPPHSRKLVSERLNGCHDVLLTHLGSFIGRLQLQSQSRPQLALSIKQSATSGGQLLLVVDLVCSHHSLGMEKLGQCRAAMYDRIRDLVHTARDVLTGAGPDMEDVIVPQDNSRLLGAATSCVKATGECVAKTKWVIEKIGDFDFELGDGPLLASFDWTPLQSVADDREGLESRSIAESHSSEATSTTCSTLTASQAPRPATLSTDKPLPQVPPQMASPARNRPFSHPSPPPSRPQSLALDEAPAPASVSAPRLQLPLLSRISTTPRINDDYSPAETSAGHESEMRSFRSESITASSAGSASTYISRDSESSIVSSTWTRATTPEMTLMPKSLVSDVGADGSAGPAEEDDEVESRLLKRTHAHELLLNKDGQVQAGSLPALVERLTTHDYTPDAIFMSTFYLTFRLFCSPFKLAEALIDRFDYVGETPQIAGPVRLRTYNVFKGWMESHWRHETDCDALVLIRPFAEYRLGSVLPSAGRRLCELADKVCSVDGSLVPRLMSSMGKTNTSVSQYLSTDASMPPPILGKTQANALANWKAGGSCPNLLDFDPQELARQLTVKQMAVFCVIMPEELLGSKWTKRAGLESPNVKAMANMTTNLSNVVADTILQYDDAKKRAAVVKHWIKIGDQCLKMHNYDALMAIITGLHGTSIKRLKLTWDSVSSKRKELLKTLEAVVDVHQNSKVLRARLHNHVPPCLPFLGMFLTDLTFVDVGNPPTKQTDTGLVLINLDKHTRTARIIGELQRFQIPYRFTEVTLLQQWLAHQFGRVQDMDKPGANAQLTHYRKSLMLEPRDLVGGRTPLEPAVPNGMFGWIRSNTHNGGAHQI